MAYAPAAIWAAANKILENVPGAQMSGIVGDVNHSYGYHLARNECRAGDYSIGLSRDRGGNASAASALDIKLPPDQMIAITARLDAAAKARVGGLAALREFAGTLDGRNTYAYDLSSGRPAFGTWDDSHLWHIHLSGYRDSADDTAAWLAIADVFIGGNASGAVQGGTPIGSGVDLGGGLQQEEDDMFSDDDRATLTTTEGIADETKGRVQSAQTAIQEVQGQLVDRIGPAVDKLMALDGTPLGFAIQAMRSQLAEVAGQTAALAAAVAAVPAGAGLTADQLEQVISAAQAAAQQGAKDALANLTLVSKEN